MNRADDRLRRVEYRLTVLEDQLATLPKPSISSDLSSVRTWLATHSAEEIMRHVYMAGIITITLIEIFKKDRDK